MPGVFMDAQIPEGFASFSAEESQSPPDWGKVGYGPCRVGKRREKNRDAARKSRKKQTERADLLHEELQHLERTNAVLEKEIADLKAEQERYTRALQQHEPLCSLHSTSEPARYGSPQAGSFTSTSSSTLAFNMNPTPVARASSSPSHHGDVLSDLSLTQLLDSSDWTPSSSDLWKVL